MSVTARKALQNPTHTVHVNTISFWEISLKAGLGKLRINGVEPEDYPALARESGWLIDPLDVDTAASIAHLPSQSDHRDPFDRMLVWTAIRQDLHLVSQDRKLASYTPAGLRICW